VHQTLCRSILFLLSGVFFFFLFLSGSALFFGRVLDLEALSFPAGFYANNLIVFSPFFFPSAPPFPSGLNMDYTVLIFFFLC